MTNFGSEHSSKCTGHLLGDSGSDGETIPPAQLIDTNVPHLMYLTFAAIRAHLHVRACTYIYHHVHLHTPVCPNVLWRTPTCTYIHPLGHAFAFWRFHNSARVSSAILEICGCQCSNASMLVSRVAPWRARYHINGSGQ